MGLGIFTVWATGVLNGYSKEGLPASYKYVPISLVSAIGILKGISDLKPVPPRPGGVLASLFIGIPIVMGASFCTGTFFGKSIRHVLPVSKIETSVTPLC